MVSQPDKIWLLYVVYDTCVFADDGWVDTTETSAWDGFKKISEKLLNFSGENKKQVGGGHESAEGSLAPVS